MPPPGVVGYLLFESNATGSANVQKDMNNKQQTTRNPSSFKRGMT
jgi:hypothetical protein